MMTFIASLSGAAADPASSPKPTLLPDLGQLFWAIILLGGVALTGIVWVAVIRRNFRRQTTAIQQREAALIAHYRDLFENAHDIIFSLDLQGRLLSLNHAGEQVLGFSRQEAAGLSLFEVVAPHDREALGALLHRVARGQESGHCDLEATARDGRRVALRMNIRLQALAGRDPQVLGVAWDVTERKQAEEALRESEQRLRHSLEERIRIGRDLHDGIIQSIYAIGLALGECRRAMQEDPDAAGRRLTKAIADLNAVIREVRSFIVGLEPEALKGREFRTAVEALSESLGAAGERSVSLDVDSAAANQLSAKQASHLLQVVREAMSNSLRHSHGSAVTVSLHQFGGGIRLEVRDNGGGFEPGAATPGGLGLRNIEARASELGGRSEIDSAPGRGTIVRVDIPGSQLCESV